MQPTAGSYRRPLDLAAALAALAGGECTILAGGTDLYAATTRASLAGEILDITALPELRGIDATPDGLRIGAATTWAEIAAAPLPPAFDALRAAAREVGGRQIQNVATIAGNIANASPAADGVPPLLVLDAAVELASPAGIRRLALVDFLRGPRRTLRRPDEVMTALHVPAPALRGTSVFRKLGSRRNLVISIAMVAVRIDVADGRVRDAALAIGACGPVATRLASVETALIGRPANAGLAERIDGSAVVAALAPIDDIRAAADYRLQAATELLRRAVADLMETAP